MTTDEALQQALNDYVDAGQRYREAAEASIEERVKARYPTATHVRITAIMDESYSEHTLEVFDGETHLNAHDDWPYENEETLDDAHSWVLEVSEGAAWGNDSVTLPFDEMVRR